MSLFSKKKKEDVEIKPKQILIVDIGSDAVSVAGGYLSGSVSTLGQSVRVPFCKNEGDSFSDYVFTMLRSLRCALEEVGKSSIPRPDAISCFLRSPWSHVEARTVVLREKTPFVFTDTLAKELTNEETTVLMDSLRESYQAVGDEPVLLDMRHVSLLLDGYNHPNPLNKKAREADITFFASVSSAGLLGAIEEEFERIFTKSPLTFYSGLFSSFVVASDLHKDLTDFMVVDIGGEVTDILLVKGDKFDKVLSFPHGTRHIERSIASTLGRPIEEIPSLYRLEEKDMLEYALHHSLNRASKTSLADWSRSFSQIFEDRGDMVLVPDTIFLLMTSPLAAHMSTLLAEEPLLQYTHTKNHFTVIPLGKEIIPIHSSFLSKTNS